MLYQMCSTKRRNHPAPVNWRPYGQSVDVLIITGGHLFAEAECFAMVAAMAEIRVKVPPNPEATATDALADIHTILFYHMAGIAGTGLADALPSRPIIVSELGDSTSAFGDPDFRHLIRNALRWTASHQAQRRASTFSGQAPAD
jgi:hypothetical protein